MHCKKTFLLILVCFGLNFFAGAQHFNFSHLDISQGLSNNQVNFFFKDANGFLWIGTMSGLNRYDGYQFKIFKHNQQDTTTLSDDYIAGITEGPFNKLWIGTRAGYNIYDPVTERFERNINAQLKKLNLPQTAVTEISKTSEGDFLFLMNERYVYRFSVETKKTTLLYRIANESNTLSAIEEDSKGQCWLIYHNGLIERLDEKTGSITKKTGIPARVHGSGFIYYSLFIDREDELWIRTSPATANKGGVIRYNPETDVFTHLKNNEGDIRLNSNLITSIIQDNNGLIWLCTDHGGVNLFNKKKNTISYILNNVDDDKSISQNSIITAYKDNTGIVWLGTYKKGVSYYHENIIKFPVFRHQPSNPGSLSFDDVNRFAEDASGNIWIGTNGGGLLYFDRVNNRFQQYLHQPGNTNSISNNVIVSLCIDSEQKLWIGSYFGGLDCYNNGRITHYRHDAANANSLSDDRVWEIFEDSKKNLWVGTLSGGLERFDRKNNVFHHYNSTIPNSIHSNYISAIIEDREGKLWIGTDNGIDVIDQSTGKIVHYVNNANEADGLTNNNIICLFEDSRGLIWIGTGDGLCVYNKQLQKIQSFRARDGLPENTILNILEDQKHTLWISTTKGISNVEILKDKNAAVKISCQNYTELDGLQATEFNENAALKTSKGELLFGGARGFNIFDPQKIVTDKSQPHLVFTDLQIFNKSVGIGEEIDGKVLLPVALSNMSSITFKHNENILGIEFSAMILSNPRKIKYAYKLEGFNKDWLFTDSRMRKAIYTNLDPGTYTFRLKATTEDGQWSDQEITLQIKVLPPFWRTNLAFLIYLLVIASALFIARKIILDRAKMRFEAIHQRKEAERIQAVDVMKTKFFTNVSHEFRTPLSLILSPLDKIVKQTTDPAQKKQLHLIQRNAKRLLNLINQLLDFRKMEVQEFSVQFSKSDIVKFVKDITSSFSDISEKKDIELAFQSDIESLQTLFDKDKLEKILFNLLSNAFKYTPSNGKVKVELMMEGGNTNTVKENANLLIKISDTGIGIPAESQRKIFEPYFQENLAGNMHNYGTGIGLAITTEFVRLHKGTISVESEPEKGTCFTISLPIRMEEGFPTADEIEETVLAPEEITSLRMDIDSDAGNAESNKTKKHTILLVEDNEDFRFYLKDNLKHNYHVVAAVNGKEGWKRVRELNPDIVVSDIMMPEMNGIELSKIIKTDPATSHIPVILLTAMTTVENELEGFQAGANDYITKPFTFEILESRIKNLLSLRLQMQDKFKKQLEINPGEITVTSADEEFMKKALAAVEKNIDNPDFSVEDLSRDLFMSRVSLYKKLLSITGKTPIEFIRIMRLKRAAQLLKNGGMNISEVAYEVGFNNPKVFTKYFKEEFNMTPSQYSAQK